MVALQETQFELDGYVFGRDLPINVRVFDIGGVDAEVGDVPNPVGDGLVFGRDFKRGMLLTFEVSVLRSTADEAKAEAGELAKRWDSPALRGSPRQVVPLRIRQPGSRTVVVYGRPRAWERTSAERLLAVGRADYTATFMCADNLFYAESAEGGDRSITLSLVASAGSGITWPVTWPIAWGSPVVRQDAVVNAGDSPSWPVITIRGPVAQPSVELVGTGRSLRLDTTLAFDRSITIDTRPWVRSVLRDDGASMAGVLRGAALAEFQLPPGQTVFAYRGTDMSGQSTCTVAWRDAYSTP